MPQNVEILGRTRVSVERDSMAAYDDEAGASMVELDEDVAKVVAPEREQTSALQRALATTLLSPSAVQSQFSAPRTTPASPRTLRPRQ
jgi:hypothetical protein